MALGLALAMVLGLGLPGGVGWGAAQGNVTAEVDPRETVLGRPVTLRVLVPGDGLAVIDTTPVTDFTVTPRGRSVGSRTGPDGTPATVAAYRFELTPRRAGDCLVPGLVVETGGARHITNPVSVTVRPGPAVPKQLAGKAVLLDAALSRPAPYRGQTLVYSLRLFRSVAAAGIALTPPAFDGFSAVPLPGQTDDEIESGGRRYAVSQVAYALTPLRAGRLALAPATARLTGLPGTSGPTVVTGPALEVVVRPLPPLPPLPDVAPATGLVGRLELDARLETAAVAAGREAVLAVTLSGRGNIPEAVLPGPVLPEGVSLRRLPDEDEGTWGPDGLTGRRTARFALRPDRPGRFVLPGTRLAVFDAEAERWRTLAAPETVLTVTATAAAEVAQAPPLLDPAAAGPGLAAARAAYAAGQFAAAAQAFETALAAAPGRAGPAVCLDVAASWRLAGDPGRAALWLYRAELADPGDARVVRALAAAGLLRLEPGLWLGNRLPPGLVIATALAGLAALALLAVLFRNRPARLPWSVWLLAAVTAGWLAAEAGWLVLGPRLAPRAVVTARAAARCAPEAAAETLFALRPGTLVRLGPTRDGFVRVDAGNDALGWVARDSFVTRLP
ncbi:BatD family protein [Solidesulfovibrio sp.]